LELDVCSGKVAASGESSTSYKEKPVLMSMAQCRSPKPFLKVLVSIMHNSQLSVLFIGAGVSGLALARLLSKSSMPYRIFESSPKLSRQSYGVIARSWVYGPVLRELGVPSEEFRASRAADRPSRRLGRIDPVLYDLATGQPLIRLPLKSTTGAVGFDLFVANRNRLRQFFAQGIEVRYEQ
jgi:monooxygenase